MIHPQVTFQDLALLAQSQILEHLIQILPQLHIQCFLPTFGNPHNMILGHGSKTGLGNRSATRLGFSRKGAKTLRNTTLPPFAVFAPLRETARDLNHADTCIPTGYGLDFVRPSGAFPSASFERSTKGRLSHFWGIVKL